MSIQNRNALLFAYRELRRAINLTFKNDKRMLNAAKTQAYQSFRDGPGKSQNQGPLKSPAWTTTEEIVEHALAVAQVLRQNVVQGSANPAEAHRYRLRIHNETERGDNETVKNAPETPLKGTAKKWSKTIS